MKELAIAYDVPTDTLRVQVPHAITAQQLALAAKAGYDIDCRRYLGATGDKKELLGKRIAAYRAGRVQQLVVAPAGDVNFYKATEGAGRIISIGN